MWQADEHYDYEDEVGHQLFRVERRTEPKGFRQCRPDPDRPGGWIYNMEGVRRVLYRLPQVIAAVAAGKYVFFVEGEKDVHSLEALGYVATTIPGGAGKWRPEYVEPLRGAKVAIIADRDGPGRKHAAKVAQELMVDG